MFTIRALKGRQGVIALSSVHTGDGGALVFSQSLSLHDPENNSPCLSCVGLGMYAPRGVHAGPPSVLMSIYYYCYLCMYLLLYLCIKILYLFIRIDIKWR